MQTISGLPQPTKTILTDGIKTNETYAWFPCKGKSMTCESEHSIPDGCLLLGRLINIKEVNDFFDYLHHPVIIMGKSNDRNWCFVKTISFIEFSGATGALELTSYNKHPMFKPFWIPADKITHLFIVEQIKIQKGSECLTKVIKPKIQKEHDSHYMEFMKRKYWQQKYFHQYVYQL